MRILVLGFFVLMGFSVFGQETFYSMEAALKQPEKVKHLILKREKLKDFPKEILSFSNLEELNLTGNRLSSLPKEITQLKNLKVLNLSRNSFVEFPKVLTEMVWLKKLDLWDNDIENVAPGVEQMKALVEMELRGVQLPQQRIDSIRALLPNSKVHFSDPCDCIYKD